MKVLITTRLNHNLKTLFTDFEMQLIFTPNLTTVLVESLVQDQLTKFIFLPILISSFT